MKKVLSLFLSVLMLTSIVAAVDLSAYAATTDSGKCGENLVWEYSDGVLTISGEGKMYDYVYQRGDQQIPWHNYEDNPYADDTIYKVIIQEGVTNIGNYAFAYCSSLRSITLPESITYIGESAFFGSYIKRIIIPKSVLEIKSDAFKQSSISQVYYEGTEEDWYNIHIYSGNSDLTTATIKYNYQAEKNSNTATEEESEDGSENIITIAVIVIAVALVLLLMLATAVIVFVLTRRHYKKT